MCIAAPGKVVKIEGQKALVEYPGEITRQAMIANEKVKLGSFVLVQMGIIIDVLSKSQSTLAAKAWSRN
jgi:hydrogenase expression/formation protein HypC